MVLYGPENDVIWMSSTTGMGKPPYHIVAQSDCDFVLYDCETALRRSDTYWARYPGHPGACIVLQNDGNLIMYEVGGAAMWDTHTGGHS
jgi:bacillolysin